jgi:YgiT-type zinc finger domain-containing protein
METNTHKHPCWNENCIGHQFPKKVDFEVGKFTVPNVPCFECEICGEQVFAREGSAAIDSFFAALSDK